MSNPNTGPSDITIRCQDWAGQYTVMTAFQGNSHETVLMRTMDLKIDQIDYELWLATLPA